MEKQEQIYRFASRKEYIKALDSVMPNEYIQRRDVASGTHYYLPAPIKEAIADEFFLYWNVINEEYSILINELVCTVKLVYQPSYPGSDELICTGTAAVPIQMDKGSLASSFPKGKKTNALEYNIPGVRTEAISNALGSLGNIFGRNLSRKFNQKTKVPNNFTIRKHE